jgi:hypothetical protein
MKDNICTKMMTALIAIFKKHLARTRETEIRKEDGSSSKRTSLRKRCCMYCYFEQCQEMVLLDEF